MRASRHRLPASLGASSYDRLTTAVDSHWARRAALTAPPPTPAPPPDVGVRVASLAAIPASFVRVAAGVYLDKTAHAVWELRPALDGDGFVMVRKREERAPDFRTAARTAARTGCGPWMPHPAPAVPAQPSVLVVNVHVPAADGADDPPVHGDDPFEPTPGGVSAPREDDPWHAPRSDASAIEDDDEAHAESLERQAALAVRLGASLEDAARARWVTAVRAFKPELTPGVVVQAGDTFHVDGWHQADPRADADYGVPRGALPYPNAKPDHWYLNARVRLRADHGRTVFATLRELDLFFAAAPRTQPDDPVPDMPGDALPPGTRDDLPAVRDVGFGDTSMWPTQVTPLRKPLPRSAGPTPVQQAVQDFLRPDSVVQQAIDSTRQPNPLIQEGVANVQRVQPPPPRQPPGGPATAQSPIINVQHTTPGSGVRPVDPNAATYTVRGAPRAMLTPHGGRVARFGGRAAQAVAGPGLHDRHDPQDTAAGLGRRLASPYCDADDVSRAAGPDSLLTPAGPGFRSHGYFARGAQRPPVRNLAGVATGRAVHAMKTQQELDSFIASEKGQEISRLAQTPGALDAWEPAYLSLDLPGTISIAEDGSDRYVVAIADRAAAVYVPEAVLTDQMHPAWQTPAGR